MAIASYSSIGALTAATTTFNVAEANPFRFSSEYADDALGLVYYNYRHYVPVTGRWLSRDPAEEDGGIGLYCSDEGVSLTDLLGLVTLDPRVSISTKQCSQEVKSHCKLEIDSMKQKLKDYLSTQPARKGRYTKMYLKVKRMKPKGSKIDVLEGDFRQLIKDLLVDLNDGAIPIRCCPPLESGICSGDHNVSTYVREAPQNYTDWVGSVVLCKDSVVDLQGSGGCACLVLHELMHKRGKGNISVNTKDTARHKAAAKAANRPNENYMIYMAQALLGKLCTGYDVKDWHPSIRDPK